MRGRYRGFTLIELLVVIAIIAILAAILFPVFIRAKAAARDQTCCNNLKQWATGLQLYIDSYQGRFPWAGSSGRYPHRSAAPPGGEGIGTTDTCYNALSSYTSRNTSIRWCPYHYGKHNPGTTLAIFGWSYYYFCPHNGNIYAQAYPDSWLCGYAMSDVSATAKKPAFCENWANHATSNIFSYAMCYCDGHVKRYQYTVREFILNCYASRDGVPQTRLKWPHGNE